MYQLTKIYHLNSAHNRLL